MFWLKKQTPPLHYNDVIMSMMASQISGFSIVCSTVSSGLDQRTHQSPASLAFVRGIHRWPVNSPHKGPVTRKMFSFDDVIMLPGYHVRLDKLLNKQSYGIWNETLQDSCDVTSLAIGFLLSEVWHAIHLCCYRTHCNITFQFSISYRDTVGSASDIHSRLSDISNGIVRETLNP